MSPRGVERSERNVSIDNIARIAKGLRISASPRSGDRERDDGSALTFAAR